MTRTTSMFRIYIYTLWFYTPNLYVTPYTLLLGHTTFTLITSHFAAEHPKYKGQMWRSWVQAVQCPNVHPPSQVWVLPSGTHLGFPIRPLGLYHVRIINTPAYYYSLCTVQYMVLYIVLVLILEMTVIFCTFGYPKSPIFRPFLFWTYILFCENAPNFEYWIPPTFLEPIHLHKIKLFKIKLVILDNRKCLIILNPLNIPPPKK